MLLRQIRHGESIRSQPADVSPRPCQWPLIAFLSVWLRPFPDFLENFLEQLGHITRKSTRYLRAGRAGVVYTRMRYVLRKCFCSPKMFSLVCPKRCPIYIRVPLPLPFLPLIPLANQLVHISLEDNGRHPPTIRTTPRRHFRIKLTGPNPRRSVGYCITLPSISADVITVIAARNKGRHSLHSFQPLDSSGT